jgi:hypothetical protein
MYRIVYYQTARGDCPVLEFIDSLDQKAAIKVLAFIELLKEKGPNLLRPYADKVRGSIRELRVQMGRRNIRALYFFMRREDIVLVHSFLKKTDGIREQDLQLAESRMADWTERFGGLHA